jgi:hypothetical protein
MFDLATLLTEYDRSLEFTRQLTGDLTADELHWRPDENSSAIAWHLGHQAHVAHFMVRNLIAAEPSPDVEFDRLMDSANPERERTGLPSVERLTAFRSAVADRVRARVEAVDAGQVGAPEQLRTVAQNLLVALINHEYQHDQWVAEVRARDLGHALPDDPDTARLRRVDGYLMLRG